nr:nuclease-related domain-containing protein [Neobacillus sp. Marseille-Q6967]
MLKKARTLSDEIVILRILNNRMLLTEEEKKHLYYLEKGFEGEVMFDKLTEKLESENLTLNDLLLEVNNSFFQIDSLLIYQKTLYLIDVKNYEGDFIYKSDGFYTINGKPLKDLLAQLKRCEFHLRQLLQKYGYNFPIEAYLVFINHEFTLYQAPENRQIILPTQVNSFMKKLNSIPSKLSDRHMKLADLLISLHQKENPYVRIRKYEYVEFQKGITCCSCDSFSLSIGRTKLTCNNCGYEEEVEIAIIRCVKEIRLLFPDRKITTNLVYDWCGGIVSKKMIRRILLKTYKINGHGKFSYYIYE